MSGSKAGEQRNHLSWELLLKLTDYTRANYASSKLFDNDFAELAGKALGFPVTASNILGARKALGMPSNYKARGEELRAQKAAKQAARPYSEAQQHNLILDELHALNQGLAVLLRKVDQLLNR